MPLSKQGFNEFQNYLNNKLVTEYKTKKTLRQAWRTVERFIEYQNSQFILAEHFYPKIIAPHPSKSNPLIIKANWVTFGKELTQIIRAAQEHWHQTKDYSQDEILGWLLFSGIVYGGINEKQMLKGWFVALLQEEYQPFIQQRVFITPRFEQKHYGNERSEDGNKFYNTKQIILDLVSQCWLIRYHQQSKNTYSKQAISALSIDNIEQYLTSVLTIVAEPLALKLPTFSRFLYYASYHWEVLDNVEIDQASVAVLRGNQNTTGLTAHRFNQLLNQTYRNKKQDYNLKDIIELKIRGAITGQTVAVNDPYKKAKVRKSDLINRLNYDFNLTERNKNKKPKVTPPTLNERIEKRCHQYTDFSESLLLSWVLSLLNQKKPPSDKSILQYIKTIGYEWLYFTMGQPLEIWSEEDFETLFEDILEYKTVARGNTNIVYSANLFQRLHNFASQEYGLPKVNLQHSQNGRRVRSEWVSPQAYQAIITQILTCIDILEREMFALIFILAYRTGMRKKEILGLKYNDIEGLNQSVPSVVIRPNIYRSTKTQSSIRRIPIFALLKPDELNFFVNYIQSNIGTNPNKFIFTLSADRQPIDDHVPLQLLKRILQDISTNEDTIEHTFHALRHTAVTNLSLVLVGHEQLVESLTDYSKEDVLRLKHGLIGEHVDGQDRWYALSGIIGHLSPQRSFEYYNHIATLMATYALSNANIKLPTLTLSNISGFNYKQLKENHAIIIDNIVSLPSIRTLLFRKTFKSIRKSPRFFIEDFESKVIFGTAPFSKDTLFTRYGLNRVHLLLRLYDDGMTLSEAAIVANITINDAQTFISRAHAIAEITTIRGQPRFIKSDYTERVTISPLEIQYQSDFRLLSILQNNGYQLRKQSTMDWQWLMDICQQRLSNSRAFITFSKSKKDDLHRFIDIIKQLLPEKNWLITSNTKYLSETLSMSYFKDIRQKDNKSITTIRIGIANQDNRDKKATSTSNKKIWQYSPLLRFYVHMMLITDENLTIIDNRPLA